MYGSNCKIITGCFILVLLAMSCITQATSDVGTIDWCLSKADSEIVTLTCEEVMWCGVSGKSFAIKEWTDKWPVGRPRILVVSTEPLPVKPWWSVDVTGTLATLTGDGYDQRVIITSPSNVYVYCTSKGIPTPIAFKDWNLNYTKKSLAELVLQSMMTINESGELPAGDDPPPPLSPPAPGSKDSLKHLPDGASVSLNGMLVSMVPKREVYTDFFYVERSDRSFGIQIQAPDLLSVGDLVDITGRLTTVEGERRIIADTVTILGSGYPPPHPIGLNNRSIGGGAVDIFTPPVADGHGLNNTGLLIKTWGRVTSTDTDNHTYILSDGSVTADGQPATVKVRCEISTPFDPFPSVGDFVEVYGASSTEVPEGNATSIRMLWETVPTIPTYQSGTGTISGTITATGADGKTVKVYCAKASTTATFSGDTANYTLNVPYGSHAVTNTILGYKTTTQLATVSSAIPVDLDFTLPTLQRRIDVIASPKRIPPDGVSQMTITAIVRDEEGRRFGNEAVTWDVDLGTVISSDTTTDAVGEAKLVLQATIEPGTANVSITIGGTAVTGYAEFASATAPSIRILEPIEYDTVSGTVTIKLQAWDYYGTKPGVTNIGVSVDNEPLASAAPTRPEVTWQTYRYNNGTHVIRAAVADGDQETGLSQAITVTTSNDIYGLNVVNGMFDANDSDPTKRTTTVTAYQQESTDWEIEFKKQGASSPARVFTGTGTTINATWDGTDSGGNPVPPGQYGVTVRAGETQGLLTQSYEFSLWDYIVFLRTNPDAPTALLVEGYHFGNNNELLRIVEDACEHRGFQVITIPDKYATWDRFYFFMNVFEPTVLYVVSHGDYEIRSGQSCLPTLLPQVSRFMLKDAWVNAYRPQDNQGNWFPEYPPAGDNAYERIRDPQTGLPAQQYPNIYAHYVSELGLTYYSPLKLVWMDTCLNGRIGSLYGDLSDQFNPYEVDIYGANDLASMFGIYDNAWTIGASYCGFFEVSFADDRYRGLLATVFGSLKNGYNLDQAITRDAWGNYSIRNLYPDGIDQQYGPSIPGFPSYAGWNPCNNWRVRMPPYHNLRVHGNPWSTYLSP